VIPSDFVCVDCIASLVAETCELISVMEADNCSEAEATVSTLMEASSLAAATFVAFTDVSSAMRPIPRAKSSNCSDVFETDETTTFKSFSKVSNTPWKLDTFDAIVSTAPFTFKLAVL